MQSYNLKPTQDCVDRVGSMEQALERHFFGQSAFPCSLPAPLLVSCQNCAFNSAKVPTFSVPRAAEKNLHPTSNLLLEMMVFEICDISSFHQSAKGKVGLTNCKSLCHFMSCAWQEMCFKFWHEQIAALQIDAPV